jgi:uncharacterized membrane protein YbhN (UPF0104 family)
VADNSNREVAPVEEEEISLRRRFLNVRTLLSFVVAFALLIFAFERLDIDFGSVWDAITGCNPLYYALAFGSYYLTFPLRAWRWRVLLHNVGFRQERGVNLPSLGGLTQIMLINWFANCILYARLGDAYRGYLLKEHADVSFSKTIGTVLAERVLDVIIIFLLLGVAVIGLVGGRGMVVVTVVLGVGVAMLVVIAILLGVMGQFGSVVERRLPMRIRRTFNLFREGTLGSFDQLPLIHFVALANALLVAIPFTTGGLGLVETGIAGLLTISVARSDAWSIALVDRTISFLSVIVVGLLVFTVWHFLQAKRGKRAMRNDH